MIKERLQGRITPREVLEAYERTGLVPCRLTYFRIRNDLYATGCALTAMAVSLSSISDIDGRVVEQVMQDFGLNKDYINGFVDGFDNEDILIISGDPAEGRKGWRDGRRCARFCFWEGAWAR